MTKQMTDVQKKLYKTGMSYIHKGLVNLGYSYLSCRFMPVWLKLLVNNLCDTFNAGQEFERGMRRPLVTNRKITVGDLYLLKGKSLRKAKKFAIASRNAGV